MPLTVYLVLHFLYSTLYSALYSILSLFMSTCCICYEEATSWFTVNACGHRWCVACEEKYEGVHCVLCRVRFRNPTPTQHAQPFRNFDSYSDYQLEAMFGVLPNRKIRRRKYYRALRQFYRQKQRAKL